MATEDDLSINLPINWELTTLDTIASVIDPQPDHRRPELVETGYPYIGLSDILPDGSIDVVHANKVSLDTINKQRSSFQIKEGDILFGKIGTVGSPRFLPFNMLPYALNTSVVLIQPKTEPRFVMACLESPLVIKQIYSGVHTTSQPRLGIQQIRSLFIPLPPLPDQRRIAEILGTWDEAIALTGRLIYALRDRKKGLMQRLLSGEVRFPAFEGGKQERLQLADLGVCLRGVGYKPETDLRVIDEENTVRLLRANNIAEGQINIDDLQFVIAERVKAAQYLQSDDIAICIASGSKELVGKAAPFRQDDGRRYTVGAFCAIFRPHNHANAMLVRQLFQSNQYRSEIRLITAGSSINNLRPSDIEQIPFEVPCAVEERAYVGEALQTCDDEIQLVQEYRQALAIQKRGLMQQLLTGQIRVGV